jgi:hypothetical protein
VAGIDAPTLREQGIALDLANWRGVVAPPGLTESEREALTARVERMAASAQWKAVLAKNGWEDLLLTGAPFRQFLLAEQQRIEQVLRTLSTAKPLASAGGPRTWFTLRPTPQTLPFVSLIVAVALCIGVVWKRSRPPAKAGGPPDPADSPPAQAGGPLAKASGFAVIGLLLGLLVHAFALPLVGFIPSSAALFVVTARLMGSRRLALDVALGVAGASVLFFVVTRGLGLAL